MGAKPIKKRQTSEPSSNRWLTVIVGGAIIIGLTALGVLLYLSLKEPEVLDGLTRSIGLSRGHDENAEYGDSDLPPVGGIHSGIWQNCGIYDEPVLAKNAVHSMEHGAVWIAYQPDLAEGEVARLQDAVRGEPYALLSPYPGLKSPVVLTAWGIQLELDSAKDGRISDFVDRYQQGPQTPERGASCVDGTGSPIG
ncbi:MAG TPA: DUF3105 domain-containing protein [candidate division Zixibacteria bacterium]|nr:DUF3105 domain-containing protein [candidate division Zixibacteria bacterium]